MLFILPSNSIIVFSQDKHDFNPNNKDEENATGSDNQIYYLKIGKKAYPIKYSIEGGSLQNITIVDRNTIKVYLETVSDGSITIEIPKNFVGKQIESLTSSLAGIFGSGIDIKELRVYTFDFKEGTTSFEIEGIIRVPNSLLKNIQDTDIKESDSLHKSSTSTNAGPFITNLTIENIPQFIWLNDPGYESYNLTLRAFIHNDSINFKEDYQKSAVLLSDWNPFVEFDIPPNENNIGFVKIDNLVIGKIKNYANIQELFKEIQYWKNIPLNDELVLRLDQRGTNFIIAELQFSNGDFALYGAALEIDASESKSNAFYWFKKDKPEDVKLIAKETKTSKSFEKNDKNFWIASQNAICKILTSSGFNTCNN